VKVHNQISRGELTNAMTRALGVTRVEGGVERFGETVTPTLDLWQQPEWALLRQEFYAGMEQTQAAVAAEFGCVALINPATSGLLVVVEGVNARATVTNMSFILEVATEAVIRAALGGVETRGLFRDRRKFAVSSRVTTLIGSEATSVGGSLEQFAPTGSGVSGVFTTALPLILPPGHGCVVRGGTLNLAMAVSYGWRERVAYPGELVL
jgi:hypothetical protein